MGIVLTAALPVEGQWSINVSMRLLNGWVMILLFPLVSVMPMFLFHPFPPNSLTLNYSLVFTLG